MLIKFESCINKYNLSYLILLNIMADNHLNEESDDESKIISDYDSDCDSLISMSNNHLRLLELNDFSDIYPDYESSFDDIQDGKVVLSVLCSIRRDFSLDEPTYLIQHLGSFTLITPLWNLYYSDIYGLIKPIEALEKCKKYYIPDKILNERDINMIHKLSRIIKCEKFLD